MSVTTLRFTALDTLFFRESRPHETIGGSELASLFPPPSRTVAGAIRTAIGDYLGADWNAYKQAFDAQTKYVINDVDLSGRIGFGDDLGQLSIHGIWLSENGERLYPAPLFLLRKVEGEKSRFNRLIIGDTSETSLGRLRLPQLPKGCEGYKPMENVWLTRAGLESVLSGGLPKVGELREKKCLYMDESRLGIARNNSQRTVETGLLYQTRHVRPVQKARLSIETDIDGLDGLSIDKSLVRLGGEGRMAGIEVVSNPSSFPEKPKSDHGTHGLIAILLTAARFVRNDNEPSWLPREFHSHKENSLCVWKGIVKGISLTVHSAVIGKAQREGGWDLLSQEPRATQSLIPAGSSYFCTVDNHDIATAIQTLHGHSIGEDQQLGRGRIVCGLWKLNKSLQGMENKT